MPERPPAVAGSRREAREVALTVIYEADVRGEELAAPLERLVLAPEPYARTLVKGVEADLDSIDRRIGGCLHDWTVERLPALDRTVLRIATYELRSCPEVPTSAILNEAVELASEYSTAESGRFVNGVLASVSELERG